MWVMFVGLQLNERHLWYVCVCVCFSSLFLRLKIRIQCSWNYHFLILMFSICCFFFFLLSIKSLASKRLLHVQCASMHLCNLNGLRTGRKAKPSYMQCQTIVCSTTTTTTTTRNSIDCKSGCSAYFISLCRFLIA